MMKQIKDIDLLIILTFIAIIFPQFVDSVGLLFEWLLTGILFFLAISFICLRKKMLFSNNACIYSCIMFLILFTSIIRSINIFIINDLFELMKPFYFLSFFLLAYNIKWDEKKLLKYFSSLMGILLFFSIIGIFEATTNLGNTIMSTLYKGYRPPTQYKAILSFISPYTLGSLLMLPVFYFFMKAMSKYFIKNIIIFFIFFICLILTQSRTSLICFVLTFFVLFVGSLFFYWLPFRRKLISSTIILISIIVILFPILVFFAQENLVYLYSGINVVVQNLADFEFSKFIYSSPSIYLRYEQLLFAIENQDPIPLIGVAVGKSILMPESFYAMYLYRVGVIGILLHFIMLVYSIYCTVFIAHKYYFLGNTPKNKEVILIFCSISIYFVSFFFSYFSSAVNDQTRTGFIFYSLVGMLCYYKKYFNKIISV